MSECQIFHGDEIVFGKWSCISQIYTYSLRWEPIVLCYSRRANPLALSTHRSSVSKYNIGLSDSCDDNTTHIVARELRTTIKILCGLSKGVPIVQQSWVDQLILSIENSTPIPNPSDTSQISLMDMTSVTSDCLM